eukprot:scaffold53058_cov19-Tisochrysis_lutea.AAC.2
MAEMLWLCTGDQHYVRCFGKVHEDGRSILERGAVQVRSMIALPQAYPADCICKWHSAVKCVGVFRSQLQEGPQLVQNLQLMWQ